MRGDAVLGCNPSEVLINSIHILKMGCPLQLPRVLKFGYLWIETIFQTRKSLKGLSVEGCLLGSCQGLGINSSWITKGLLCQPQKWPKDYKTFITDVFSNVDSWPQKNRNYPQKMPCCSSSYNTPLRRQKFPCALRSHDSNLVMTEVHPPTVCSDHFCILHEPPIGVSGLEDLNELTLFFYILEVKSPKWVLQV